MCVCIGVDSVCVCNYVCVCVCACVRACLHLRLLDEARLATIYEFVSVGSYSPQARLLRTDRFANFLLPATSLGFLPKKPEAT